jgi:hypothetical protein
MQTHIISSEKAKVKILAERLNYISLFENVAKLRVSAHAFRASFTVAAVAG